MLRSIKNFVKGIKEGYKITYGYLSFLYDERISYADRVRLITERRILTDKGIAEGKELNPMFDKYIRKMENNALIDYVKEDPEEMKKVLKLFKNNELV